MTQAHRPATHDRHYAKPAQKIDENGSRHWITRAANFVVVVSDCVEGGVIERPDQADEYMVLAAPGCPCFIEAGEEALSAPDYSLTIVPPGSSRVHTPQGGLLVQVYSSMAQDILALAANSQTYADGAPEVAPIVAWPTPPDGFRLRTYSLASTRSPDPSPLKMRVFRSTNLMVNVFEPWTSRRDEANLSPHSHDDFEQISVGLRGSFIHHLRYPWGSDRRAWRDDEHESYDSPSALVIPARVIHTTQDVGGGVCWLLDVFGPPRRDFSMRPGFVINERDYPPPADLASQ